MLYNSEIFDSQAYGEDSIIKESRFLTYHVTPRSAGFMMSHLKLEEIEDETDLV